MFVSVTCPDTRPAWLTTRLVPSWGQRQEAGVRNMCFSAAAVSPPAPCFFSSAHTASAKRFARTGPRSGVGAGPLWHPKNQRRLRLARPTARQPGVESCRRPRVLVLRVGAVAVLVSAAVRAHGARACSQSHHGGGERACARLVLGLVSADRWRPRHADDRDRSSLDPVRIPQFADLRVHLEDSVAGPLLRHHRDFLHHRLAAVWNVAGDHPGHLRGGRGRRVSLCVCLGLALFRGVVVCVLRRDLAAIAGAQNANRMIAVVLP